MTYEEFLKALSKKPIVLFFLIKLNLRGQIKNCFLIVLFEQTQCRFKKII
jgi:hypothetical protein